MSFLDATRNTTTSNLPQVAVPNGAGSIPLQADDIVFMAVSWDSSSITIDASDWPTGFTPIQEGSVASPDGQKVAVAWKRLTGADSGNYVFASAVSASQKYLAMAISFRGRDTGNNPVAATIATNTSANASPVTITANAVTAVAGDDLLYIAVPDVNGDGIWTGFTAPTDYTTQEEFETNFHVMSLCTRENVSAGSTGTVSGTATLSSGGAGWIAMHFRIPAIPSGGTVNEQTLSSTLSVTDEPLDYVFYTRVLDSPVEVFDSLVSIFTGTSIQTKVLDSTLTVSDGATLFLLRQRLLQDTIIVSEGNTDLFINTNVIVDDTLDIVDEILSFARYTRLGSDTITVTDSLLSTVINYLVISSILTSNLTVTDEAVRYAFFARTLDSFLSTIDGALTPVERFILLSDALSVDDGLVATYVPGESPAPATHTPVIRVGFDQPRIDIGGYAVN